MMKLMTATVLGLALVALPGCGSIGGTLKFSMDEHEPLVEAGISLDPKIKQAVGKVCETVNVDFCKPAAKAETGQ